ncbi:MAG TPA: DNA-formamidopyrimidine glycosylase family protein [Polyangiaceae bacterium LLY-WYZ-14_1]|nr:DNA-formamidopyrimidine glycosylase family protein [Polyangiaceae bacterium LLY-WYZ-14_1]
MPEGDTLYNLAAGMRPDLVGRPLRKVWVRDRGEVRGLRGRRVEAVDAHGKHLLVRMEGGVVLRTHLGLKGIWHRYRQGEPWRRSRSVAVVVLETDAQVFVCFRATQVALGRASSSAAQGALSRLGPDLTADAEVDLDRVARRARARVHADVPIGELLLDQTVAAGIGNVFKSEVLFLRRVHPWARVGHLDDDTLRGLYEEARDQLQRNRRPGARTTTPDAWHRRHPGAPRYHVYGRSGRPCLRCGGTVTARKQGAQARTTYWCPRCQPRAPLPHPDLPALPADEPDC